MFLRMLNFRKLKQDFSSSVLEEGKGFFDKGNVANATVLDLSSQTLKVNSEVTGNYEKTYSSEIEIDRRESEVVDSCCDCPNGYDCQHIVALLFHLEKNLDSILVSFSNETDLEKSDGIDEREKSEIRHALKVAESKESLRNNKKLEKVLLEEYYHATSVLGTSSFFLPEEKVVFDKAELVILLVNPAKYFSNQESYVQFQLALRLPLRAKPLNIPDVKTFLDSIKYGEEQYLGNHHYFYNKDSFEGESHLVLKALIDFAYFPTTEEKAVNSNRYGLLKRETFANLLANLYKMAVEKVSILGTSVNKFPLPCICVENFESPLQFSTHPASLQFKLDYLSSPAAKISLEPKILINEKDVFNLDKISIFECENSGVIHDGVYFRFASQIKRKHLRSLNVVRDLIIPEPLFGSLVENSLPVLSRFASIENKKITEKFVTLPFVETFKADCKITYLNGELEVILYFFYGKVRVNSSSTQVKINDINKFVTDEGILARNLIEEQGIINDLFYGFQFQEEQGSYLIKSDKKIIEFMTEIIPRNKNRVNFQCPENLMDRFIYDDTEFLFKLKETDEVNFYEIKLEVNGRLQGVQVDLLWDCVSSKRAYIELKSSSKKSGASKNVKNQKILVLNLEKLSSIVQLFDELGVTHLDNHKIKRSLWSLMSVQNSLFKGLPVKFSISKKLQELQQQMLGNKEVKVSPLPKVIHATLRKYQKSGVHWLERLRKMFLSGILADDMGLGKTLQAIITLTQFHESNPKELSLVVCPTSLIYNWKEEFYKFNPGLKVLPVDGTPAQRKKILEKKNKYDVLITSYSLLQKDVPTYDKTTFGYIILDEAQHIKNRSTRNAKSVKMIQAVHRLILTGTPIENSLEELWSLFDFLMPGFLSTYERFIEKYIRLVDEEKKKQLAILQRKVAPFILRRMKKDVLKDLPPVSNILYHCHLSKTQRELYNSYAASAREELSRLVEKEGFEKVQIHVLATLTRLKQICCHPAIFAKEKPEEGDSAKYDMLMELLQTLIEGKHKTVIFSQYTRMLHIIRDEIEKKGISFAYLDGTSKNRLEIVKKFNEDKTIPIFLVSLKAGGTGLNLVGADTVIHYDMWWNPAVENQATDRVHRIGQKNSVSSYKLITLGTIEEKILEMQARKKSLVKQVITGDDEVISKLTWEEVLELLQT